MLRREFSADEWTSVSTVQVYNVKEVALPGDHFFKEIKDHSKYAISGTSEGWVCVGGINRDVSTQDERCRG